jgi:predicted RNA binding protein YcfA (HicA-like mRNA interferase family)
MKARDLRQLAKRAGWTISTTNGGHLRLEHPEANGPVITGSTPSDHRAIHQARAAMRRALRPKAEGER